MRSPSAPPPLSADVKSETIYRGWPFGLIAFGLGITAIWACLLVYGVFSLIKITL